MLRSDSRTVLAVAMVGAGLAFLSCCVLPLVLISLSSGPPAAHTSSAATPEPAPAPPPAPPAEPPVVVDAVDLTRAYKDNVVAADATYTGKMVQVRGQITSIDQRGEGAIDLALFGYHAIGPVAHLALSENDKVLKLERGIMVTVVGRCRGRNLLLHIDDCQIISPPPR